MNAPERRRFERVLMAYLSRRQGAQRNATLRRMHWRERFRLHKACWAGVYHTLPPIDPDKTNPIDEAQRLRRQEDLGDLSEHIVHVLPAFAKRYPRAAKLLPDWYRRMFKKTMKSRNFARWYGASPETIKAILNGDPEPDPQVVAAKLDKGFRHLAKITSFTVGGGPNLLSTEVVKP